MKLNSTWFVFCLIIFLATFFRIYAISTTPVSLYWDEVAIGYNAYSIAETGKDEYGNKMPLLFKSFDDYKMPGSIYTTALFTKIFGLSEVAVRLPSALFGIGSVIVTYFFVVTLLRIETKTTFQNLAAHSEKIALLAAGLLAISPWHIQFSRTGFEANFGLFFILLGFLLFFKGFAKRYLFIGSFFFFAVSFYFYRSVSIFLPLLLLFTCILFFKGLFIKRKRYVFLGGIVFLIVLTPMLLALSSSDGLKRFNQVRSSAGIERQIAENAQKIQNNGNQFIDKVRYNRRIVYAQTYTKNYLSHFSPQFLLFSGDTNGRHHVFGMGQLYVWEGAFLIIGLVTIFQLPKKIRYFLLAWLLLAPLPATFSFPAPHALRSLYMLPTLQIVTALGIYYVYVKIQEKYKYIFVGGLCLLATIFLGKYLYLYYTVTPKITAAEWGDGYKQLVSYTKQQENTYEKIIVSGHYWQPYTYFLFYKKYDPATFQTNGSAISFDKYYFGGTSWDQDKHRLELDKEDLYVLSGNKKSLIVLSPEEYAVQKNNLRPITTITNTYGEKRFIVSELKEKIEEETIKTLQ